MEINPNNINLDHLVEVLNCDSQVDFDIAREIVREHILSDDQLQIEFTLKLQNSEKWLGRDDDFFNGYTFYRVFNKIVYSYWDYDRINKDRNNEISNNNGL